MAWDNPDKDSYHRDGDNIDYWTWEDRDGDGTWEWEQNEDVDFDGFHIYNNGDQEAVKYGHNDKLIDLEGGDDYLWLRTSGGNHDNLVFAGSGNDEIVVSDSDENSKQADVQVYGGDGNDLIYSGFEVANELYGGAGTQRIDAYGGAGNDTIRGSIKNDTLHGGTGDDSLFGRDGDDIIFGAEGNDSIEGNSGRDTIYGGDGNDHLVGNEGNDIIYGGSGDDVIDPGARTGSTIDKVITGAGRDLVFSGGMSDVVVTNAGTSLSDWNPTTLLLYSPTLLSISNPVGAYAASMAANLASHFITTLTDNGSETVVKAEQDYVDVTDFDTRSDVFVYTGATDEAPHVGARFESFGNKLEVYTDITQTSNGGIMGSLTIDNGLVNEIAGKTSLEASEIREDLAETTLANAIYITKEGSDFKDNNGNTLGDDGGDVDYFLSKLSLGDGETVAVFGAYSGQVINGNDVTANTSDEAVVSGTEYGDVIYAGDHDSMPSSDKKLFLFGHGGNDYIKGGSGTGYVDPSSGQWIGGFDEAYGGDGNDTYAISSASTRMTFFGDAGTDMLDFSNIVNGGVTADLSTDSFTYHGAVDADINLTTESVENIRGTAQADTLIGDANNNVFYVKYGEMPDTLIDGGVGTDTILFGQEDAGLNVKRLSSFDFAETLYGIERIELTQYDDVVNGFSVGAGLYAGAGEDVVKGGGGADLIYGDAGSDVLYGHWYGSGGSDADTLYGGDGHDVLMGDYRDGSGGGGDDYLHGGQGNDHLIGGGGADILIGHTGDDALYGNDGDDRMHGGAGADTLYGGDGSDVMNASDNNHDGTSLDLLYGGDGQDTLNGDNGVDRLYGGANSDVLSGYDGDDVLSGNGGDDTLKGGGGLDRLYGGDGDDGLHGYAGNDYLNGGANNDVLMGGLGADELHGGSGNDILYAYDAGPNGSAMDSLYGGDGQDVLYGDNGDDIVSGGAGDDVAYLGDGNDIFDDDHVGNGADTVYGGVGDDKIWTGDGADILVGDSGSDFLSGENGDDTLYGGEGTDTLYGGEGADRFVFSQGDGTNYIYDWDRLEDSILLENVDKEDVDITYDAEGGAEIAAGDVTIVIGGNSEDASLGYYQQGEDLLLDAYGSYNWW